MRDLLTRLDAALGDRYHVEHEVGRGGMAIVFLAEDRKHRRRVAIKVLKPELAPVLGADRFLREIEIAAQLAHPNILPLYDSGEVHLHPEPGESDGPLLYYVMPYVEGETLRDRLNRQGQLPLDEAVQIAREVSDALGYAHSLGLLHRDIKPENILFQSGHAMVADFGIARAVGHVPGAVGRHLTESGIAVGTPAYMSPEQAAGMSDLDSRTDIYSLGCLLYEMLVGEVPLRRRSSVHSTAGLAADVRAARKSVSMPLANVIGKALAIVAADRFATAAQFRDALGVATGPQAADAADQPTRRPAWISIAALASTVAVALALVLSFSGVRSLIFPPVTGAGPGIKLVVLPFDNLTGDPAQEYFSDGLTEEMITELGRLHPQRLAVIARTSAMRYKKTNKPADQIGRELGVQYMLEGATRREGSRVRISAQLIRVRDQTQLWGDSYDRELTEILSVQSAVAQAVARSLALALLPGEKTRLATTRSVDPEAYEAYLKGMGHQNRLTKTDLETALQYFAIAVKKDSSYALAHVGIAAAWLGLQQMGFVPPREAQPRLKEAASRALALDSTLAEAHYYRGVVLFWSDWDWASGEEEFRKGMRLNPNFPNGRAVYAHALEIMKRPEEATAHIQRALELDPFNPLVRVFYGVMLHQRLHHEEAIAQFRQVLAAVPNNPVALNGTQNALYLTGRYREAMAIERSNWAGRGFNDLVTALDQGYAEAGYLGAERRVAEAFAMRSRKANLAPIGVAGSYVRAGDMTHALEWLERSYQAHDPNLAYLGVAPMWVSLHGDPRFQDLLQRMKLPP